MNHDTVHTMTRQSRDALIVFASSLLVYLYNLPYRLWGAGGDTTPAELLPVAFARNGNLTFDGFPFVATDYWFTVMNGHVISSYPIVPGLLNFPTYLVAHLFGSRFTVADRAGLSMISASIITAVAVVFFYLSVQRFVERWSTAIAATLLFAFGTTAFSVAARGMWQHAPSLLFLNITIWCLTSEPSRARLALAGFAMGMAFWTRPPNLLLILPIAIYVVGRYRSRSVSLAAGAALPLLLMAWYSLHYWGSVQSLGQYRASDLFTGDPIQGLTGLFLSPSRGLFVFTPLFVFSYAEAIKVLRVPKRQPLLAALAAGVMAMPVLYAFWWSWWGGDCFGYRLLTECTPGLCILLALAWETTLRPVRSAQVICGVLFAISLYIHLLGAYLSPCRARAHDEGAALWSIRGGELDQCTAKLVDQLAR